VEFLLERFTETRDDIRCEVTVNLAHPEAGGRLFSGRLLLVGPNSRRDVRRELETRIDELDWGGMLEQVCLLARDRYRRGEPVIDLFTVPIEERRRFLVEPFVLDGAITILYGDGGVSKSSLALRWALMIALNYGPVLYLDWEDDAPTHAERLRALCRGMSIEYAEGLVHYQRRYSNIAEASREIRRSIAELGIVFVIVDSLGMASGDPTENAPIIAAMKACRSLGVSVLVIHHLPKDAKDKSKPFGGVYAANEARLTWLVEKTQEEDSDVMDVLFTNYKANRSRLHGKRAMRLTYENKGDELICLTISDIRAADVEQFRAKLALWQHIAALLKGLPKSTSKIKEDLASEGRTVTEANIRRAINEHKDVFINVGGGGAAVYALRSEREPEPSYSNAYA
jgi:hypothetical protein